jgi:tRNA-splicing ligase RtcB (3'-phosphate/5'-hydroxy nucleic acid ligase)
MRIIGDDIPVWGDPVDPEAIKQIMNCRRTADWAAMMADHHKGYAVPIGGVVAYRDSISPSGVGYDIACGNKAVLTDAYLPDVKKHIEQIMNDVYSNISFGIGQKNNTVVEHELFDSETWKHRAVSGLKEMARHQLGTVGSGNHYVDIFEDENDNVWIGVHFGSRGLGHKTATFFLEAGGAKDEMDAMPLVIPATSPLGEDYLECMTLAGQYAYAGRDWVCKTVAEDILGANILSEVHNHHNFAWREFHQGEEMWVVRKGATPAFPGQLGFVGGSMGDISVILEGVDSDESNYSLNSTVHGAGRVMSRTQAAGKMNYKTRTRSGGQVTKEMMMDWVNREGVTLRGADTDESPQAYKRLPEVLAHHSESVNILHVLKPLGVAMAGGEVVDPYKD